MMKQKSNTNKVKIGVFFVLGIAAGLLALFAIARLSWHSKFYPGISVAQVSVAGLTRDQAKTKLEEKIAKYQGVFSFNGAEFVAPKMMREYDLEQTLNIAYHYGRRLNISDYLLLLINKKTNFPLITKEGKTEMEDKFVNEISQVIEIEAKEAEIKFVQGKPVIVNGEDGTIVDSQALEKNITSAYANLEAKKIVVPTLLLKRELNGEKIDKLKSQATVLYPKELTLKLDDSKIKLGGKELAAMLNTKGDEETLDQEKIETYTKGLAETLNREPQDAKFEYTGGKVTEFAAGKDGTEINVQPTIANLRTGFTKLLETESKSENIEIAVTRTPPKITTEKVNELGIKERIGRGESYYQHSIPNRIYNVALASERINSALVPPGEEVSFNKMVGEVSGATGYRPAYIISAGRTVLGDGGGLCQVSTTMFRAAMDAGLPITERWGHAYRVSYYELNSKPGVDATVIAPSKDFRFVNDTPGHILIQTINDPKALHLVIEIYGTSDGRVATMSEPKVWGNTPPLPTIYQDDPTLPAGTMRQVDWAAAGAKASFEYKVVRNGETVQDKTFSTTYRPWAAVYLKGTGI